MKKCDICGNELFYDENDKLFCPDCEANEFLETFDEADDRWLEKAHKVVMPKTKPITIRLNVYDIEKAKAQALALSIPYQTFLKDIIHKKLANG
ncbi:MAG: BrnA antitoxin family protein [Heliobacteriaceae bacterium]|jgi:predicted DNA binding CopG/RHH family protein|nr:BrnA antitoxin family protein [Heliobacteriaceae bacterium]